MKYKANSPEEYIRQLPEDRQEAIEKLRKTIKENLPKGFEETMSYGMIGYVIPHSIYPSGYHVNPKEPLPFMSIASQKNFIGLYHMGIYSYPDILAWFQQEYPKYVKTKLDMGKGCIRFKKMGNIPYDLIAELCRKITLEDYLRKYETEIIGIKK
ncbi:DUF1801 domain-containing protein [Desulfosporosinus fructosivorans]|uniref:DUF1801 domain-containing protein n=1 Tax=Desulfosporosinus fructosivorans TaxID=2018669 RepID=A0A4Z0R775_9FIRM|nr:DUF1801 domain-containing protein [Desulfosporosinus fructosivorans]TGE38942.1 DUF1801 domain-containing protein [Desulfosporosinus fructosivorans]